MFVLNFKILGQVVSEKSLTEKSLQTHTQTNFRTEKAKTIYPLYTSYNGGIIKGRIDSENSFENLTNKSNQTESANYKKRFRQI